MIEPYASKQLTPLLVGDAVQCAELTEAAKSMPRLLLNSAAAANAVMLAGGYFTPLQGYMNRADALRVASEMKTTSNIFWPVPVVNRSTEAPDANAKQLALCDPNVEGNPVLAIQTVESVEELSDDEQRELAQSVFGTTDREHPGVASYYQQGKYLISGPIQVLNQSYFPQDFADTYRTAVEIRAEIQKLGWETVVAFQTRNPMHRAHEELCKIVAEQVRADGVLIHMLLGKLKPGDIPADVRDAAIRKMVELYFPAGSVMVTGYGFDMLYAGPREALLHAVFRQNCGCTHLIVGRDHAGVGDYYEPFAAQDIFSSVPEGSLKIKVAKADHTAYSKKLNKVVMMRDVPDHSPEDFVLLSGTAVRQMLSEGKALPEEFARPEVAKILMDYYTSLN